MPLRYRTERVPITLETLHPVTGKRVAFDDFSFAPVVESQYIDALNVGKFTPGVFRCTSNTLCKIKFTDIPYGEARVGGYPNYSYVVRGSLGCVGNLFAPGSVTINGYAPDVSQRLKDLATIRAYARMNGPEVFDGGVFLAELAETIAMLRNPLSSIVKLLKSRRFRDPHKLSKAGQDTWMEFRYGMRPFIGDCATVAALFGKRERAIERKLYTKRARISRQLTTVLDRGHTVGSVLLNWHERGTEDQSYNAGVSYDKKFNLSALAHGLGVHYTQLPSILWEKVPLSFVADWFYSTGDWLRAISPNPAVEKMGGFISVKRVHLVSRYGIDSRVSGQVGSLDASATLVLERLDRYNNPALPALPVRTISTLSLAKVIDSCILTIQRIPTAWKQVIPSLFGRRR